MPETVPHPPVAAAPDALSLLAVHLDFRVMPALLRRLWIYARASETEISALGEVNVHEHCITVLDKLHMLKQKGSLTRTHLDEEAVVELLDQYVRMGYNPQRLRFWYHTHPGAVFFSPTDEYTILGLSRKMNPFVAGVLNQNGESHWAVFRNGHRVAEFDYKISLALPTKQELKAAKPLIASVVSKTMASRVGGWLRWGGSHSRVSQVTYDKRDKVCGQCGARSEWYHIVCLQCRASLPDQTAERVPDTETWL